MAYSGKTNWVNNEIVEAVDMNRIEQGITNNDALKADKTYIDNKVKTDVPSGAKFTDTVYTHPPGTNPHGTTKSDVGLGNVDNVKQMPISGGVLESYREKLITVSPVYGGINLPSGNVFQHTPSGNQTYAIYGTVGEQACSFTLIINQPAAVKTLAFPASVKWAGGVIPDLTTANKTYVLTFMSVDGGTTWLGTFGGKF